MKTQGLDSPIVVLSEPEEQELRTLYRRYPALLESDLSIRKAYHLLRETFRYGGRLLTCGNGGSAADADHIVGELMKGFKLPRPLPSDFISQLEADWGSDGKEFSAKLQRPLETISLTAHTALIFAFNNDVSPELVFAQQVLAYGRKGDVLLGLSTSGNSKNVVRAIQVAKTLGVRTIALTGSNGGLMKTIADVCVTVPAKETFAIQEFHLPIYHALCSMLEVEFFS